MKAHSPRAPRARIIAAVGGVAAVAAAHAGLLALAAASPEPTDEPRLAALPQSPRPAAAPDQLSPTPAPASPLSPEQVMRRRKCAHLWQHYYSWSYSPELVDFFCGEHERAGMPDMWWHSFVYGVSGSGLVSGMICRGGGMVSRGMMDCSWTFARSHRSRLEPLLSGNRSWGPEALFDPWVSIRCHVLELAAYRRQTGRDDWDLMRMVFLPASPDGGRTRREQRRWERIERKHLAALRAYAAKHPDRLVRQPSGLAP